MRRLLVSLMIAIGLAATPAIAEPIEVATASALEDYQMAGARWAARDMDAATYWFYRAQLRAKMDAAAHPEQPPDGAPALYASFNDVLGRPINEYAFGDVDAWAGIIDRVLAWEAANDDPTVPKASFTTVHGEVAVGLKRFRDEMLASKTDIQAQRAMNGLPTRR